MLDERLRGRRLLRAIDAVLVTRDTGIAFDGPAPAADDEDVYPTA